MSYINQFKHPPPRLEDFKDLAAVHHYLSGLHQAHEREFQAIQQSIGGRTGIGGITVVNSSISGGGGSASPRTSIHIEQAVGGAGTVVVVFPNVGTTQYGVMAYVLKDNGDFSSAIPLVPPRSDSRATTQVQVDVQESGLLHTFVVLNS